MKMKTKKESSASPGKLSEPWRNTKKGELVEIKRKTEEQLKFRVAGYVRLSPTGDEREEGSLVSHPQRIKQFIESKNIQSGGNWGEIIDWYVDKDLSGKDMNRPAFQKMLADIKSGKINAVVVTELSRLNRKVKDFCEVYEFFKEHTVALFSLKENFDTSTPMGELMLIQAMSFAQFERQTIVDRIKKGARARAERGLANGCIPLGFKPVPHRPNHREVDEAEKAYVEMIFRKFLEIKGIHLLVTFLNGKGYKTKEFITKSGKKAGGNRWTISSLYSLLTNRSYIGEREVNKKNRGSESSSLKDEDRYFFVDAQWPALISKELFFDVQRLLEQNKNKARRYTHQYRLTGLIECEECGARLIGKSGTGKNGKYFYYGHMRKLVTIDNRHLHRCKIETIPALQIEEAIIGRVKDLSTDRKLITELAKTTAATTQASNDHKRSLIAAKEQERRKLDQRVKNIYEAIADETDKATRSGLSQKAKEISDQLSQIENALFELKKDFEQTSNVVDVSSVWEYIRIFRENAFDGQSMAAQAEILKNRIRRIVVRGDGVYVEIYGRDPQKILTLGSGGQKEKNLTSSPEGFRSGVRPVFKLVVGPRR
jgi:site-specific DNA recombinase